MLATSAGNNVGFWDLLLVACIAAALGLIPWTIGYLRKRGGTRREDDRREDTLWGYTDATGIRHLGLIESQGEQIKNLRLDNDEIHEILERNNLK